MHFKGTGALLLKDLDTKKGIVQAYWSAFGNIDDDNDIIEKGCWTKSVKERGPQSSQPRIKFLYQHEEKSVISRPSELVENSTGLLATCQIPPTTLGKDVLILYEYGILSEHSVGYETVQSRWDVKSGARLLLECVLWEGSVVTWGANSQTPVVAIKSLTRPDALNAMADRAAKIDTLLHNGNLRSEDICNTLDRELKALHAALAPADAGSQPYTIQGVTDSMTALAQRLGQKAANSDDKAAQEARAKKYGIGIKDGGNVTKPSADGDLADTSYGDPTNYRYPLPDKAHADNAAARFAAPSAREQYTAKEQDIIAKRIMARQKDFDEEPDWWPLKDDAKAAPMTRQVKGSNGSITVAADGTHAAYTGTHAHGHKTMGSQGGDESHEHLHSHDSDAKHDHSHDEKGRQPPRFRKAMDFATALTIVSADDTLQDEWGDSFQALVNSLSSVMWQSYCQAYMPTDDGFDAQDAAETVLSQFSEAMSDLVQRSIAADFVPELDWDGDSFLDPDGINANAPELEAADGWDSDYKGRRTPQRMPTAPAPLRKSGRAISSPNRQVITDALDGMTKGMAMIQEHHAAIADLMTKTDPDATRQDEDDTQGDDDTENGGTNINHSKSRTPAPDRRKAGTTHQAHSTIFADFDAITSRIGRKAP